MASQQGPLTTRGLFLHVWDLRDEGVDHVLGWMQEAGFRESYVEHLIGPDSMVVGIK